MTEPPRSRWEGPLFTASLSALAAVIVGLLTSWENDRAASRSFDAKMVEIGVSILSADPSKTDISPAREWAISVIEAHTSDRFSDTQKSYLLHNTIRATNFNTITDNMVASGNVSTEEGIAYLKGTILGLEGILRQNKNHIENPNNTPLK